MHYFSLDCFREDKEKPRQIYLHFVVETLIFIGSTKKPKTRNTQQGTHNKGNTQEEYTLKRHTQDKHKKGRLKHAHTVTHILFIMKINDFFNLVK